MNLPAKLPSELPSVAKSSVPIVIRFGRLGDMLLLAPLLHRLHRGYGNACVLLGDPPQRSRAAQIGPEEAIAALCSLPARQPEVPHAA